MKKKSGFLITLGIMFAVAEYLCQIQKQASVLIMRECRPEYWAPCGVGILREICRDALGKKPEIFSDIQSALNSSQSRMRLKVSEFATKSTIMQNFKRQTRINQWI